MWSIKSESEEAYEALTLEWSSGTTFQKTKIKKFKNQNGKIEKSEREKKNRGNSQLSLLLFD